MILSNMNSFFNRTIWPKGGTLTGTTTPGQSRPGCNSNEVLLHIVYMKELTVSNKIYILAMYIAVTAS